MSSYWKSRIKIMFWTLYFALGAFGSLLMIHRILIVYLKS